MKTKALISFAVSAKLICIFVFAYSKSQFSHNEAHIIITHVTVNGYIQQEQHKDNKNLNNGKIRTTSY